LERGDSEQHVSKAKAAIELIGGRRAIQLAAAPCDTEVLAKELNSRDGIRDPNMQNGFGWTQNQSKAAKLDYLLSPKPHLLAHI
jgi:hypothetical protein